MHHPDGSDVARAFLVYTVLRALVFVFCFGVLVLLHVNGLLAVAGALLVSSILSLLLLREQRDRFTAALERRRAEKNAEIVRLRAMLDQESDGAP